MKTKKVNRITAVGETQENPTDEIQKQIESQIKKYQDVREKIVNVLVEANLGPIEWYRILTELQATSMEQFAYGIDNYIVNKLEDNNKEE